MELLIAAALGGLVAFLLARKKQTPEQVAVLTQREMLDKMAYNGGYMSWQHYVDSCVNLVREKKYHHVNFLAIHAQYEALSNLERYDDTLDSGVADIQGEDIKYCEWARWMLADSSRTYLELLIARKLKEDATEYDTVAFSPKNAIFEATKTMREIVTVNMVDRAVDAGMDRDEVNDVIADARDEAFEQGGVISSTEREERRQRRDEMRKRREAAVAKDKEDI